MSANELLLSPEKLLNETVSKLRVSINNAKVDVIFTCGGKLELDNDRPVSGQSQFAVEPVMIHYNFSTVKGGKYPNQTAAESVMSLNRHQIE